MNQNSVFIVEDEIITAKGIAHNLEYLGYKVAGMATSGSKALAQIENVQPDLVLMDILLKKNDLDGIDTANKIRKKLNIPIIFLTAHSDEETLERAKVTEPFGYIRKPYNQKDLEIALKIALYKHAQESKIINQVNLLSTILNSAPKGVVATSETASIIYMNQAAQQLTGWELSEAKGKKITEIMPLVDDLSNEPIPNPIEQVLKQGKVVYIDDCVALVTKQGEQMMIGNSAAPLNQGSDKIQGAVIVFANLDFKAQQTQLAVNLAVNQATKSKPEEVLIAQKQFHKLRSLAIEMINHEFRIPLTVILSSSESLRCFGHKWSEEKQNDYFDRIQQAVWQMKELLNDVAVWEQVDKGRMIFDPELLDVNLFCEEVLDSFRLIDSKLHHFNLVAQKEESMVVLDETLVRYILNNLISNAIKYSEAGTAIDLVVELQLDKIMFQVIDRGIGITPEASTKIFQSFYRAENTQDIPGTGLGLAIVQACVAAYQGEITVASKLGQGSTFTVTLPIN